MSNNRNITPEELEQIERFLQSEMDAAEAAAFSDKIRDDKELRAKVDEVKLMHIAIGEANLQEQLQDYQKEIIQKQGGGINKRKIAFGQINWGIAASVLIIVSLAAWWYYGNQQQRLYSSYYAPDPGLMTTMSSVNDHYEFDKAMVEYKNGDYDKALAAWEKMLSANAENDTLVYFIGSALQAKGEYEQAITYLQRVATDTQSALRKDASWYLGLLYLRTGDKAQAIRYIEGSEYPQSTELAKKIK